MQLFRIINHTIQSFQCIWLYIRDKQESSSCTPGTHLKGGRVSPHVEDRVLGEQVEETLVSRSLDMRFGDSLLPLGGL